MNRTVFRFVPVGGLLWYFLSFSPTLGRTSPPGSPQTQPSPSQASSGPSLETLVTIPGPLRSFLRMAAISQKTSPEDILPLVARNVVVEGYHYSGDKPRKPTEFLILLKRYLSQARELQVMAGLSSTIRASGCADVGPLLKTLGYRFRQACGPDALLETEDPERAFLTVDSGFPLTELEEDLRQGKPFSYSYPLSKVPVLFRPDDWASQEKDVLDSLLDDPALARLYWGLSRLDEPTQAALRQSPGLQRLLPMAAVLDFYGEHIAIRSGRVLVPGGQSGEAAWRNLTGANPDSPGEFVAALLQKDEGWLAAYFDALSRVPRSQQAYFTEPRRLRRFYEAMRGKDKLTSPARPVFRPTPGLYLLTARLLLDSNGQPHVPGNLEVWKEIFRRKSDSKLVRDLAKGATGWKNPEDLLDALFALSRLPSNDGPFPVYLRLMEMDRRRAPEQRLRPQTVRLLAEKFSRYKDQYLPFSEWGSLDNASIERFLAVAASLDAISDRLLRSNATGLFQATIGLWQILARQEQIPDGSLNRSWQAAIHPFAGIRSSTQLYDATRTSLEQLWLAAAGKPRLSQAEIIALLAGPEPNGAPGQQMRQEIAGKIRSALDAQRLVSLDTLLDLGDGLSQMAQGQGASDSLIRLAGELREFQAPPPLFSTRERSEWAAGLYHRRNSSLQSRTDLSKVFARPRNSASELAEARGVLAPFLRDVLVGLNYAYYEPPGAQMLHNNPLFVRSHDFSPEMTMAGNEAWQTPRMLGRGWTASGGVHLAGSLADIAYVLAQVEQDFIVPENTQSLIWADLVPGMVTSAILPRWWRVTPAELEAVALYQQLGEELVAAAGREEPLRQSALDVLSERLLPRRLYQLEQTLEADQTEEALSLLMPAEVFYLGVQFRQTHPEQAPAWGTAGQELERLAQQHPEETGWERISRDFGVPRPMLSHTYARELLPLKPFPTFLGYSSRLLAESWESNNLYWARLAHEKGLPPAMLHRLVPALTHRMVEKIFATHLEDWPAVLRALRETGDEFRLGKIPSLAKLSVPSGP